MLPALIFMRTPLLGVRAAVCSGGRCSRPCLLKKLLFLYSLFAIYLFIWKMASQGKAEGKGSVDVFSRQG